MSLIKKKKSLIFHPVSAAIPASKVGRICTASTAAAECGDPATTHLGCSTTAPIVCVCSAGYMGVVGGDCSE